MKRFVILIKMCSNYLTQRKHCLFISRMQFQFSFSKNANFKNLHKYSKEITFVRNKIHTILNIVFQYFFRHVSIQRQMIKSYLTTWIDTIIPVFQAFTQYFPRPNAHAVFLSLQIVSRLGIFCSYFRKSLNDYLRP